MTTSTPSTIAPTDAGGLLLLTGGVRSLRVRPPLNLSAAEADTALEIVHESLKEL